MVTLKFLKNGSLVKHTRIDLQELKCSKSLMTWEIVKTYYLCPRILPEF